MMSELVVHVGNYDPQALDGVSATLVGQCDALMKAGTKVEVWTFQGGLKGVGSRDLPNGLRIHYLPRYQNAFLAAVSLPAVTREWLRSRLPNIKLFHLHSVFSPQNNKIASLGVPYGVTPNGGWGPRVIHGRRALMKRVWIGLFERSLWRKAAFVQAVSLNEVVDLEALKLTSNVIMIPNGTEVFPDGGLSTTSSHRKWLFLGRLAVEQKGLDLLLEGYAAAKRNNARLPRLVLAGPDFRGGMQALKERARDLGIEADVEFLGPITGDAKNAFWQDGELFIHTSRWEGLPLSILEALGHGVPCLVTPETGFGEWMERHECGWSVIGNEREITKRLNELSEAHDDIKHRSRNTRPAVATDFSWSSIASRLQAIYSEGPDRAVKIEPKIKTLP